MPTSSATPTRPSGVAPGGDPSPEAPARRLALLGAGLLLIALNLRFAVAAVGPVVGPMRADLGFSGTTVSLLTSIPVFAFGVFAFLTPSLQKRWGMHRLLGVVMAVLTAGILLRMVTGSAALFGGTVLVGLAIAVGNVVMPTVIKQDFTHRAGPMMGLYSTALFMGAAAASGITAPLAEQTGSWRHALAAGAVPALAGLLLWLPQVRRSSGRQPVREAVATVVAKDEPMMRRLMRDKIAWGVTLFMGIQSLVYYVSITWIPSMLQDGGMDVAASGWMLSFSQFPAILTALFTPALVQRFRSPRVVVVLTSVVMLAGFLGLLLSPLHGTYVWMILLGLAQGATISLALSFIVLRSPDVHHTGHLSTMAQGFGYLLAGLGPVGIGALHTVVGGWTVPVVALAVVLVLQTAVGFVAGRDAHVLQGRRAD